MQNCMQIVLYSFVATLLTASVLGLLPLWVVPRGCGLEDVTFYEYIREARTHWATDVNNNTATMIVLFCLPGVFVFALIAFVVIQKTNTASDTTPTE